MSKSQVAVFAAMVVSFGVLSLIFSLATVIVDVFVIKTAMQVASVAFAYACGYSLRDLQEAIKDD